jgi:hypothetical protein
MKMSTPALIASAIAATTLALSPTVHAQPANLEALCAAQTWPRPVPDVVGLMFEPYSRRIPAGTSGGALACWDDIRGIDKDGRDARKAATGGWAIITAISPPPGTPVDRDEPITVHLAPMDYDAPKSFAPCDWVSTAEVADIFGLTGTIETDGYVAAGSVEPNCTYRSPGRTAVLARLNVAGAFPVDAAAEYSLYPDENATPISGLGLAARCVTDLHGAQGSRYNEVVVLLDDNRLFEAQGLGGQPCDELTQFAKTAIGRLDSPSPCSDGQVQVSNGGQQAASGHREVVLIFSLAPGAQECTLTGYPGVDSGAGGPLIHAIRTMAGFMGGLRGADAPPTIAITATAPARAVVEGVAANRNDPERTCPTYTELLVTAPDTATSVTVPVDIDTCELQVHPMGSSS